MTCSEAEDDADAEMIVVACVLRGNDTSDEEDRTRKEIDRSASDCKCQRDENEVAKALHLVE